MLIGTLSINEKFFEGYTLDEFKAYFEAHNWKETTGKTADQVAKLLKIGKVEKPTEEQ